MVFLKLARLGLFLILLGIIFQRCVVDTMKDLPPSDSRLNRGHLIREYPCVLIKSDDTYTNSVQKITSVMISFACLFARGRLM